MTTKTLKKPVAQPVAPKQARSAARGRERFAYWLIAPALAFMVLVHLIPTGAGTFLSLLDLNTFTFQQLFGAPWAGLSNYDSILFDSANPLHSGFTNAAPSRASAWCAR
jgi:multiple sugar transport system permease protein